MATAVNPSLPARALLGSIPRFRQFAWAVLGYNVIVILWGAIVRATGAGAGCGSRWPLCDGEVIPSHPQLHKMIEYGHRVSTTPALLGIIALCIWAFMLFPRGNRVRKLTVAAVVLIFVEALLGAGLVLFQYVANDASVGRAFYLAAHQANTLLLLAALATSAWYATGKQFTLRLREVPWPFWSALPVALLVCITGTIAALGDTLFPSATLAAGIKQDFSPAASFLVKLRLLHPFIAAAAGLLFATVSFFALQVSTRKTIRFLSVAIILSTFIQLCAGVLNLTLLAPVWMQIVHLFLADVVWVALVLFVAEAAIPIQVRTAE